MDDDLLTQFRQRIKKAANADNHQELDQFFLKFEADTYNRALRDIERNITGTFYWPNIVD